jgi:oligopeptide/dipeptide ABC transporter ATP-binding protein
MNGVRAVDRVSDVLLAVDDLAVEFHSDGRWVRVVDGVSLSIRRGEVLGLVGESGSGKTVTALAVMGLIPKPFGRVASGRVMFDEMDLARAEPRQLDWVRGRRISMIFQEPARALNPAFTVGEQIAAVVRRHTGANRQQAWNRAVEVLDSVHIPSARLRAKEYPYMFSGGMCQRVMIAMALACEPDLVIADEPTTALDVTVQDQILRLLDEVRRSTGVAILLITHDLAVIAAMCSRVGVMYAGQIVEEGLVDELFERPRHPYTAGLLDSLPRLDAPGGQFGAIPGRVPPPGLWPSGCHFHPRCRYVDPDRCTTEPIVLTRQGQSSCRCVRADELVLERRTDG